MSVAKAALIFLLIFGLGAAPALPTLVMSVPAKVGAHVQHADHTQHQGMHAGQHDIGHADTMDHTRTESHTAPETSPCFDQDGCEGQCCAACALCFHALLPQLQVQVAAQHVEPTRLIAGCSDFIPHRYDRPPKSRSV